MAISLLTRGGGTFELSSQDISALEHTFPTKDVQGTLAKMQQAAYSGKHRYTKAGMQRAIKSWLMRSPDQPGRVYAQTTPWEESYWFHREKVQGRPPQPTSRRLSDEEVHSICAKLRDELQQVEKEQ